MTIVLVTVYSAATLNADIARGSPTASRSLPIWQPAPIVGALLGEIGHYLLAGAAGVRLRLTSIPGQIFELRFGRRGHRGGKWSSDPVQRSLASLGDA
jgi:hypothetical protein